MQTTHSIHFVMQGKGGVGKSLVASVLAQYFASIGNQPLCLDTDPVNRTLSQYAGLESRPVELNFDNPDKTGVDEWKFDAMMQLLLDENRTFVVDNGAATFLPLSNYILQNAAMDVLNDAGKQVFIHCVVTGGQGLLDTVNGFANLARNAKSRNIVVWQNEFFGPVAHSGKRFTEMAAYQESRDHVHGVVTISARNPDTFGRDIEELLRAKATFREGIEDASRNIMVRQRLKMVRDDLFAQIHALGFAAKLPDQRAAVV